MDLDATLRSMSIIQAAFHAAYHFWLYECHNSSNRKHKAVDPHTIADFRYGSKKPGIPYLKTFLGSSIDKYHSKQDPVEHITNSLQWLSTDVST